MAFVKRDKVDQLVKSGHLVPEKHLTGLYISEEDAKKAGMEGEQAITLQSQPGKPVKEMRHVKGWWPEKKKIEAATLYAATGSVERVAELTKIPIGTIRNWVKEDWFLQVLSRVKREENFKTDRAFTKIVDTALDKLMERIEHGDHVYDIKQGKVVPIPMSGRDLAIVTGTIFDKRQLIRGEATKITEAVTSDEHLEALANKFKAFVQAKRAKELPVIEIDPDTGEQVA